MRQLIPIAIAAALMLPNIAHLVSLIGRGLGFDLPVLE